MAIAVQLDEIMADRRVSLNELSEKVGVTNVNLSRIKTARCDPCASPRSKRYANPWNASRATY